MQIVKAIAESAQAAGQLVVRGAHGAFNMRLDSVKDLTSDRLFRFFQHFTVETPCVMISGSVGNSLTAARATGGLIKMSGIGSKAGGPDYLQLFLEAKVVVERF